MAGMIEPNRKFQIHFFARLPVFIRRPEQRHHIFTESGIFDTAVGKRNLLASGGYFDLTVIIAKAVDDIILHGLRKPIGVSFHGHHLKAHGNTGSRVVCQRITAKRLTVQRI